MRKFVLFMAFAGICLGCSDDDEVITEDVFQEEKELLTEKSPWVFESLEVLEIHSNSNPPQSKEAIGNFITNDYWRSTVHKFDDNGTGSFTDKTGDGFSYDYETTTMLIGINEIIIDNGMMTYKDVEVTENSLKFTLSTDAQVTEEGGSSGAASFDIRLTYVPKN